MTTQTERLRTWIPSQLRSRRRDVRGYPVPFIVMEDRAGNVHFPINDDNKVSYCVKKRCCGLCGRKLDQLWFVGGPRCFLNEHGAFLDPANHRQCAEYALQVCPYLAAPNYGGHIINDSKLDPAQIPANTFIVQEKNVERPALFMLGHAADFTPERLETGHQIFVVKRWRYLEFWKDGKPLDHVPDATLINEWRLS